MLQEEVDEVNNAFALNDDNELVGELSDLIVISSNHIAQMGYDVDLVMKETIKKISSRVGSVNPSTGKWEKDKSPSARSNWYSPNYSTCKIPT